MNQLPVLEINNIGKAYRSYRNNFMRFASWFGLKTKAVQETWTLKNINFKLMPGEAVGIIGQNGAGKSTLLKIITGTLKPSTGNVTVRGKISAILELGMGFHPDLTGRQNAYHAAGLMGYSQTEIDGVIDYIENFADIGDYFEQTVRTYSSGMQARVAFAVATAFQPDILIIDEALSVGDVFFGIKCLERMEYFQEKGTSILFVTHDTGTLRRFCERGIVLKEGNTLFDGDVLKAISLYALEGKVIHSTNDLTMPNSSEPTKSDLKKISVHKVTEFSKNIARINSVLVSDKHKDEKLIFEQYESLYFSCYYCLLQSIEVPYFHITVLNSKNIVIYAKDTFQLGVKHQKIGKEGDIVGFSGSIDVNLAPGDYVLLLALHSIPSNALELKGYNLLELKEKSRKVIINAAVEFKVVTSSDGTAFYGAVDLPTRLGGGV